MLILPNHLILKSPLSKAEKLLKQTFEKLYNQINQIVYNIYRITPEEQKIIEESLNKVSKC